MARENLIAGGIGFSPGTTGFILTKGLSAGAFVALEWLGTWGLRAWLALRAWAIRAFLPLEDFQNPEE